VLLNVLEYDENVRAELCIFTEKILAKLASAREAALAASNDGNVIKMKDRMSALVAETTARGEL
jgi:hypothetical protein